MKAAFVKAPFQIDVREIDRVTPSHGEVLIHVRSVGICGSDVHLASSWAREWRRFGHETVGHVANVGPAVDDLALGDLVAVRTTTNCGTCRGCMDGEPSRCQAWPRTRMSVGFAEQMVVPRRSIWKVEGLSDTDATLIEPLSVAVDLVETADVSINHDVVLVGPGPIGMMAIRLAKLRGARRVIVVGTERDRERFALCRELGAEVCLTTDEDPVSAVREATQEIGADRIIVTAPPVAVPPALDMGRYGAIVAFIGYSAEDDGAVVPIDLNAFHFAKLQLRAAYASPCAPFARANRLLADGVIPTRRFITHRFRLDDLDRALDTVARQLDGVVKAVVEVGEPSSDGDSVGPHQMGG